MIPVAHRSVAATRAVRRLGEVVAGGVDLDRLLAVARSAPRLVTDVWTPPITHWQGTRPVIAVAVTAAKPEDWMLEISSCGPDDRMVVLSHLNTVKGVADPVELAALLKAKGIG